MTHTDDGLDWRLRNWGRFSNEGMGNIPKQHPKAASWQRQIKSDGKWLDLDAPDPTDEPDAEHVQAAMMRCKSHDMITAGLLTKHYRDGWAFNKRVLDIARSRFWKYL